MILFCYTPPHTLLKKKNAKNQTNRVSFNRRQRQQYPPEMTMQLSKICPPLWNRLVLTSSSTCCTMNQMQIMKFLEAVAMRSLTRANSLRAAAINGQIRIYRCRSSLSRSKVFPANPVIRPDKRRQIFPYRNMIRTSGELFFVVSECKKMINPLIILLHSKTVNGLSRPTS